MHEFSHPVRDIIKNDSLRAVDFNANKFYLQNFHLSHNNHFNNLLEKNSACSLVESTLKWILNKAEKRGTDTIPTETEYELSICV